MSVVSVHLPLSVLAATIAGILLNSLFIGGNASLSYIAVPAVTALASSPSVSLGRKDEKLSDNESKVPLVKIHNKPSSPHLIRAWFHIFYQGTCTIAPLAILAALNFLYCLLRTFNPLYAISIASCLGIVPYTYRVMGTTNGELVKRSRAVVRGARDEKGLGLLERLHVEQGATGMESVGDVQLIERWGTLGGLRSLFAAAAILAAGAVVVKSFSVG
ncbi:MAG: hypothetical protein Q9227_003692 [Pyrenula ochraceoflavens]